jgi:hypothetical protein
MFDYTDDEDDDSIVATGPSQGQQLPVRHDDMVQANAGYGRAMSGDPSGIGSYSRLYEMPTPTASRNGVLGTMLNGSPLVRGIRAVSGLGADATAPNVTTGGALAPVAVSGFLVAAVAIGLVGTAVGSYYVGKAVAPSRSAETKYAWWGVAAGLLLGPIGLGIESAIALNHKGG